MEAVAGVVANSMISAVFSQIFDTVFSSSSDFIDFLRKEQILPQLKMWERLIPQINALLDDAEDKQMTSPSVELWLSDLRDIAYDAEDIIDELATEVLRRKMILEQCEKPTDTCSKVRKLIPTCFVGLSLNTSAYKFTLKMRSKIERITARFQDIVAQKSLLNLAENGRGRCEKARERLPTSSLVDESRVYGREKDKETILELLLDSGKACSTSNGEIGVISIVGMGGVGKTTMAQLVYNDAKVGSSFDLRAWVCVSEEFDVVRVTRTLLQAVTSESCNLKDLNLLQVRLKEKLYGKKFFIILDDVWSENYDQWELLRGPLAAGAPGSKIIVTTRNEAVASVMANCGPYNLKELSSDACLLLFVSHALGTSNFDRHPNLKGIAEEIVKKCKGLPLAAKTLGGLLRSEADPGEWESVLKSRIWDLPEEKSGILPALRLSYHHLPSYLKRCFAYCAIFPKDYEFEKEDLVQLWMAEGLLQQPKGKKLMMDLGLEYFHNLQSRSFFQQSSSNKTRFVMHDLIHGLAQSVSREICFSFDDNLEGDNKLQASVEKVRHVSFTRRRYDISKRFELFHQMKSLRTFLALPIHTSSWTACCYLSNSVLPELLPRCRCLRVLCLSGYHISELPHSIGLLKHLRYLNLSHTIIKELPEFVSSLLNLQTLVLRGCKELKKLPQGMEDLINLHVLDLIDTDNLREMPLRIGNLKRLQILSKFIVGKESKSSVGELGNLLHLRGKLSILGLGNVVHVQDARNAHLMDKHTLDELDLQWSDELPDSRNGEGDADVIGTLQPHKNLRSLRIAFYGGRNFPSWLGDPLVSNMVHLNLYKCRKCTSLPSLGRLRSLKKLSIEGMDGIKRVDLEFYGNDSPSFKPFPSLEILWIQNMLTWEYWSFPARVEDSEKEFPSLRELSIRACPRLIGKLPNCLPSLTKLIICHCPNLTGSPMSLPSLCELNIEDCNKEVLIGISDLSSLSTPRIKSVLELTCIPEGFIQILQALKILVVSNCTKMTSLRQEIFHLPKIVSYEHLKIEDYSESMSLAKIEQGLLCDPKDMELTNFHNLEKMPLGMHSLISLKDLQIESCPELISFPETGFLSTPVHFKVKDCPALKTLPSWLMMLSSEITEHHLEDLEIEDCPSLTCFPRGRLPTMLKRLKIRGCKDLQSLPNGLMQNDDRTNISHLENLEITGCPSLMSFPEGKLPISLKTLKIWDCPNMEPLSEKLLHNNASLQFISIWNYRTLTNLPEGLHCLKHLTELIISNCPALKSFPETDFPAPSLRTLDIYNCVNLKSLPDYMPNLCSLQYLTICDCPGLTSFPKVGLPPNLLCLEIWDCINLKEPLSKWNLHSLVSLKELSIVGGPDAVTYFPDEKCPLPTTLVSIYIARLPNLEFLSMGLQNLGSLEELEIVECPKLRQLPREGLPAGLGKLSIKNCQLLKQQCSREKGTYWPLIAHIPAVEFEVTEI